MEKHNCIVDIGKMSFSDVEFFLSAELAEYNVMTFEFISLGGDIDLEFVNLVSMLKGWYSAYIIQKSEINYLKVTFVTRIQPNSFLRRLCFLTKKKGGIHNV